MPAGDVAPVGGLVVERDHRQRRRASLEQGADALVRAGRVLDEQQQHAPVADLDPDAVARALMVSAYGGFLVAQAAAVS